MRAKLHDDFCQRLALLAIDLEQLAQEELLSQDETRVRLRGLWQDATDICSDAGRLSRELHSSRLEQLGLVPAIRGLCSDLSKRHRIRIEFAGEAIPQQVPREIALCLFRIDGITGGYIGEIPPGDALMPERHLYEEVICVLNGQVATELWDDHGNKKMFEWYKWSLFAPPMNTTHRLVNRSRDPVRFLAVTNAPLAFDIYRDENFVFNCPYSFKDRFYGEEDYFEVGKKRYVSGLINIWETNFIPDINAATLESLEVKGAGLRLAQFEMAGNALVGHLG